MGRTIPAPERCAPLCTWGNRHKGEPMFVLGNGPSLAGLPLGELDPYVTVGCNRVLLVYDPTYWVYADPYTLDAGAENNVCNQAIRSQAVCLTSPRYVAEAESHRLRTHAIQFARPKAGDPLDCGLSTHPGRLHTFASMGLTCFSFAHAVGADPIILLGIDCGYGANGDGEFYGTNPWQADSNFALWTRHCQWIQEHCTRRVINCGHVPCFERMGFDDAIRELDGTASAERATHNGDRHGGG